MDTGLKKFCLGDEIMKDFLLGFWMIQFSFYNWRTLYFKNQFNQPFWNNLNGEG